MNRRCRGYLRPSRLILFGCGLPVVICLTAGVIAVGVSQYQRHQCDKLIAKQPRGVWTGVVWPLVHSPLIIGAPLDEPTIERCRELAQGLETTASAKHRHPHLLILRVVNTGNAETRLDHDIIVVRMKKQRDNCTADALPDNAMAVQGNLARILRELDPRRVIPAHSTTDLLFALQCTGSGRFRYEDIESINIGEFAGGFGLLLQPNFGAHSAIAPR